MDMRVRSLEGSDFWRAAKARMRVMGTEDGARVASRSEEEDNEDVIVVEGGEGVVKVDVCFDG